MSSLFDYSPEQQASLDAYRAKLAESTTTLDVTPDEFLDYLKTLSTDELLELEYDRAFREWKQWLEYTRDSKLISLTVAFMTAKPNLKSIEDRIQVLNAVSRNRWLSTANIGTLITLSAALKLGYEEWLAGCLNITELQASRLANTNDLWVWQCLAHNSEVPGQVLDVIANNVIVAGKTTDADDLERLKRLKAEILNNPACTQDAVEILAPDAEILALAAELNAMAEKEQSYVVNFDDLDDDFDEEYQGV
jgi:hypothetical protein